MASFLWRGAKTEPVAEDLGDRFLRILNERDAARAELDALKESIHDLSHPNCAMLLRDLAAARAEAERERLRLAACGVAAIGNTEAMVADRLTPEHPYYSASYGDVCRAVDREMAHRAEVARLQDALVLVTARVRELEGGQKGPGCV